MAVAGLLSKELVGREPDGRALGEACRQLIGGDKPPSPPSPPPVCGDLFVGEAYSAITGAAAAVQDLEVCESTCEANKECYCGVLKGAVMDALPEGPLRLTANTAIATACLTSFNWKKLVCTPACKAISSAVAERSRGSPNVKEDRWKTLRASLPCFRPSRFLASSVLLSLSGVNGGFINISSSTRMYTRLSRGLASHHRRALLLLRLDARHRRRAEQLAQEQ
mmetsp:Transcript_52108/g.173946  ORF Transcript_52108/g.173946 Transcript_52108/m.173946 type:complete len:223 (+) Transcript_52108:223-891(+)